MRSPELRIEIMDNLLREQALKYAVGRARMVQRTKEERSRGLCPTEGRTGPRDLQKVRYHPRTSRRPDTHSPSRCNPCTVTSSPTGSASKMRFNVVRRLLNVWWRTVGYLSWIWLRFGRSMSVGPTRDACTGS